MTFVHLLIDAWMATCMVVAALFFVAVLVGTLWQIVRAWRNPFGW